MKLQFTPSKQHWQQISLYASHKKLEQEKALPTRSFTLFPRGIIFVEYLTLITGGLIIG